MRPAASRSLLDALESPAVATLLLALALIATAGACGLLEPTETRYAEIAREMRASGDYLVPHLDGLPHFHKPPFAYWAAAAGFALFGENSWGARIPVAIASIATLAFTALAVRRRFHGLGATPGLSVWALGTMALPFAMGRTLGTDPFLSAAVAGYWALAPSASAIAMLGLGFFIKGPVVLVTTALPVLAAAAWGRDRGTLRLLGPAWSWLLAAVIALPWFMWMSIRTPGLLTYLLGNQLWARFATEAHHRPGPPWYFVAVLAAGTLPWTASLIVGAARAWRERSREEARLLLAWLVVPAVFFSFSGSKLPGYLLPCAPAMGMLAALGLAGASRGLKLATAATLVALAAAGALLGPHLLGRAIGLAPHTPPSLPLAVIAGLLFFVYAIVWVARSRPAVASAIVLLGWTALVAGLAPYEGPLGSPRPVARVLAENRAAGEPVVEFARFNAGLPFYLRERVLLLEVERELFLASASERAQVMITPDSLTALAARHGRVWLLAPEAEAPELADRLGLDYTPVARWRRRSLGFVRVRLGAL